MTTPQAALSQLIDLLRRRSVEIGSFTLASGRIASYYVDARRTTMSAAGLEIVGQLGLQTIRDAGWEPQSVGGLTLGADPVAYAIAAASRQRPPEIDAFTVRSQPKQHGTGQRIEGCFEPLMPVVVVEDVLTTGGSVLRAVAALADAEAEILGVLALVDRQEGGREAVERAGYPVLTLVSLEDLGFR